MKYVKIYDEQLRQIGVADIDQNYDKSGYVKVFDKDHSPIGVMDVDSIPESGDNIPFVEVFDENFGKIGMVTANNIRVSDGFLVTLAVDPTDSGAVTGGGRFVSGTSVTVAATAAEGYNFAGWYNGDTLVSENASYTFTVSEAVNLTAKFEAIPEPTLPAFTSVKVNGSTVGSSSTTEVTIADDTAAVVVEGTDTDGKYLCIKVNDANPQYKAFSDGSASDSVTVADDDVLSFAIGTYADSTFTAEATFGGTATMKAAEENEENNG